PAQRGSNTDSHVYRRALSSQRNPTRKRNGAQTELPEDRAEADVAVPQEESDFGLRDAAAPGIREVTIQQNTGSEGSRDGNAHAPPRRGAAGVKARTQILG